MTMISAPSDAYSASLLLEVTADCISPEKSRKRKKNDLNFFECKDGPHRFVHPHLPQYCSPVLQTSSIISMSVPFSGARTCGKLCQQFRGRGMGGVNTFAGDIGVSTSPSNSEPEISMDGSISSQKFSGAPMSPRFMFRVNLSVVTVVTSVCVPRCRREYDLRFRTKWLTTRLGNLRTLMLIVMNHLQSLKIWTYVLAYRLRPLIQSVDV